MEKITESMRPAVLLSMINEGGHQFIESIDTALRLAKATDKKEVKWLTTNTARGTIHLFIIWIDQMTDEVDTAEYEVLLDMKGDTHKTYEAFHECYSRLEAMLAQVNKFGLEAREILATIS